MNNKLKEIMVPMLSVFLALTIGGIIMLYLKENPFTAYYYLFKGAFFGQREIARTLLTATPLIFTGLAVAFSFKAGLFNIGAQGQLIMGGLVAAAIGAFVSSSIINNFFVILLISGLAGFIWAGIAAVLKAKFGVHEVISTIMLNYIAINIEQYLLNYPLKAGGALGASPQTPPVTSLARLPLLLPKTKISLNLGFIIALLAVLVIWYILKKTVFGYEIKAVGYNATASENAGINVRWKIIFTLGIGGFLAGLGGAERVLGGVGHYTYLQGLMAEYGFDGIAVALLAKNNPIGVIVSAILFSALRVGGGAMQFNTNVPSQIIIIIQAIIILLIASENVFRYVLDKKEVKTNV